MNVWSPARYLAGAAGSARTRPALDLLAGILAHIPDPTHVSSVVDVGCGAGNMFPHFASAFPSASLLGVDASQEMLDAAADATSSLPQTSLKLATFEDLPELESPADVVYSNAALHWADPSAFPSIVSAMLDPAFLAPGGVVGIQMPDTRAQNSHLLMLGTLRESQWAGEIDVDSLRVPTVAMDAAQYVDLIKGLNPDGGLVVDAWTTQYVMELEGDNPVHAFTRETGLKPILNALAALDPSGGAQAEYEAQYAAAVASAYPPSPDGKTLFPFSRLFLVVSKPL